MRRCCGDGCGHSGELGDVGAEVVCCCDMRFDLAGVLERGLCREKEGRKEEEGGGGTSPSTLLMRRSASCGGC